MFNPSIFAKPVDVFQMHELRLAIQTILGKEGDASSIKIDTESKTLSLNLKLRGERDDIRLEINKYSIKRENHKIYFVVEEAKVSRPWLQKLIPTLLPYSCQVPDGFSAVVAFM